MTSMHPKHGGTIEELFSPSNSRLSLSRSEWLIRSDLDMTFEWLVYMQILTNGCCETQPFFDFGYPAQSQMSLATRSRQSRSRYPVSIVQVTESRLQTVKRILSQAPNFREPWQRLD